MRRSRVDLRACAAVALALILFPAPATPQDAVDAGAPPIQTASRDSDGQVTARAVSALRTLIPITAPLVRPGGELILMKGSGVEGEIGAAEKAIRKFRLENVEVLVLGEGVVEDVTRVFRARVPA